MTPLPGLWWAMAGLPPLDPPVQMVLVPPPQTSRRGATLGHHWGGGQASQRDIKLRLCE